MLPWFAGWQIDRHLSLDEAQRQLVNERLEAIHAWHRKTQLPRYAELVDQGLSGLGNEITPGEIAGLRARMFALWDEPARRLAGDLADLALTLRSPQIDRLERRLNDATAELRQKYLDGPLPKRVEARAERWQERMQWLLGDLKGAQTRELRRLAAEYPSDEAAWLEERQARNDRLVRMLRRIERDRPGREQAIVWAREFLEGFWKSEDPQRGRRLEANSANGDRVSAAMLNTATRAQREHMVKRLRDIEGDVLRMMGKAGRGA